MLGNILARLWCARWEAWQTEFVIGRDRGGRMTGQRQAMDAWDPWLVWDRVHGKAKQSMGKHGTAWHSAAWERAWAWA